MKELLEKLAILEPSRCELGGVMSIDEDYQVFFDGYWYEVSSTKASPLALGLIQLALQEAIITRYWDYELREWGRTKEALIYSHQLSALIKHKGDSLAQALLKAYIECLETFGTDAIALQFLKS